MDLPGRAGGGVSRPAQVHLQQQGVQGVRPAPPEPVQRRQDLIDLRLGEGVLVQVEPGDLDAAVEARRW